MAFSIRDIGKRLLAQGARFMGGWAGLLALNTKCPCCGQTLCPVGVVGAGFLAGLLTLLIGLPEWIRRRRRNRLLFLSKDTLGCCRGNHPYKPVPAEPYKE